MPRESPARAYLRAYVAELGLPAVPDFVGDRRVAPASPAARYARAVARGLREYQRAQTRARIGDWMAAGADRDEGTEYRGTIR